MHIWKDVKEMLGVFVSTSLRRITTSLWVQELVKPIFIMMVSVRAEREVNWPLNLGAGEQMRSYCFASTHFIHLFYLRTMVHFKIEVLQSFIRGEYTMHHSEMGSGQTCG